MIDADTAITILVNATYADEFQGMDIVQEAQNVAIDALKKQVPMGLEDYGGFNCPTCGMKLNVDDKCCHNCGQLLDWESEGE